MNRARKHNPPPPYIRLNRSTLLAFAIASIFSVSSAHSEDLLSINGNALDGILILSGGQYDQISGFYSPSGKLEQGSVALEGDICVACGLTSSDPVDNQFLGAAGNFIDSEEGEVEAAHGSVTVEAGNFFSQTNIKSESPAFAGVAGNLIVAESGSAAAQDGLITVLGGSIEAVNLATADWQTTGSSANYVRIQSGEGLAKNGKVVISGGEHSSSFFGNQLYSPSAGTLTAEGGAVEVSNNATVGNLHGNYAYSQNGRTSVTDGTVTAENALIQGGILGNFAFSWDNEASASQGQINLSGAVVDAIGNAYGIMASAAESQNSSASSSQGYVEIKDSVVDGAVVNNSYRGITGVYAYVASGAKEVPEALADQGSVIIENSTVGQKNSLHVVGSFARINSGHGNSKATNGLAVLNGGSLNGSLRGAISRTTDGSASGYDNRAELLSGSITNGPVYGAYVYVSYGSGEAVSERNSVHMSGGSIDSGDSNMIAGGYARAADGRAESIKGLVSIANGKVEAGYIIGGYAQSNTDAQANENVVELNGSSKETVISAAVYGGYAARGASGANLSTSDNTVSISGYQLNLSEASLYGGNTEATGNVLNVSDFQGQAISIGNFESIRFSTDLDDIAWGQGADHALLALTEGIQNNDPELSAAVDLSVLNGESMKVGQRYTVVSGIGAEDLSGQKLDIHTNGLVEVEASWDNETVGELNVRVDSKKGGNDSGLVHVPDVAASMLIAESAFMLDQLQPKKGLFAIAQVSSSSTNVNADIDEDGFNLMTGAAGDFQTDSGLWRVAAFLEYGDGSYSGKRSASETDGDVYFYDAGIQGKFFWENGFTHEASFRFGRVNADSSLRMDGHAPMKLKKQSGFITAHVGIGWEIEAADDLIVNPYARYHYLRINGDQASIDGAQLSWDDYVVQKGILGLKVLTTKNQNWNWEAGVAFEDIFDADAEARYGDVELTAWNMEGRSAVLHAAVSHQFEANPNWHLEFAGKAKFGDYDGYAGKVTLWRAF